LGRTPAEQVHQDLQPVDFDKETANESNIRMTEAAADSERREAEIVQVVAERQQKRFRRTPVFPRIEEMDSQLDDPAPPPAQPGAEAVHLERKPGHFGKGVWKHLPVTR
jgi:hypothetical protein